MNVKYNSSKDERNISQLVELITCNANSSENVKKNLPNIERSIIEINEGKYEIKKNIVHNLIPVGIVDYEPSTKMVHEFTENEIRMWAKYFSTRKYKIDVGDLQEMLAVIDRAVVLKRGFNLRDTQKLAVLTLLANDRSILAQVSTGEGKSLIVVAAAIMKALFGEKVDIVTSSSVLAKRDAENHNDIYSLFGITVSHNCSEDTEKRREAYVLCQVLYGDLGSFQRDYLLDRFYGKNILGDRDFSNVIVDEVDSMLVDKGNNMLYLSHDIPWMDKLESVYLFIWQQINCLEEIDNEIYDDTKYIEEAVLNDLYGIIREEDIAKIDVNLNDRDHKVVLSRLVNAKILDERGRLLIESVDELKLRKSLKPEFSRYADRISFLLQATIERKRLILVPNHLRSFVERHLKQWIKSAITAFFMNPGHDYVVDVDRTGTSSDRNANIIILDKDTGTDQANSQWDEALHQFLQLKHGCKLSMLSLKAVFISNVSYFKLHRKLCGLTGTLGSETERNLLRDIHDVDFVTIPTSRAKQFHEELPIVCCGREEWINSVCKQAHFVTDEQKRSVLIICETVKDAKDLQKSLGDTGTVNVHSYMRDYDPFTVVKEGRQLDQCQVIIATNLAGRGTDIQLTNALRNVGGLYVLLTYLPGNQRIEEQAFGRAARSGDKGSGQLIIIHSRGMEYSNAKVLRLKKERDIEEALRVSEIKSNYKNRIIAEESCFKEFQYLYEGKRKELKDAKVPDEVIKILLASCLDKWAYWLDEQNKTIILDQGDSLKNQFKRSLDQFTSMLHDLSPGTADTRLHDYDTSAWLPWVDGNPAQMIELAKLLCQKSYWRSFSLGYNHRYENSLKLFNNVIQSEPQFSEAAHYYKAFALAINGDTTDKTLLRQFKQELRSAAKLFEKHSILAISAATIVGKLIENYEEGNKRIENGYEKQKRSIIDIYSTFIRSIDDMLGTPVTSQSFVNHDIDDHLAAYLIQNLLQIGIMTNMKMKTKNISMATLKQTVKDLPCTISVNKLEKFLSNYEKTINEKEFAKALKKEIEIPRREQFWKILTQQGALQNVVSYVIVDHERIKAVDPSMLDFIQEKINNNTLKKQTIASTDERIMLYVEYIINHAEKETMYEEIKVQAKDKSEELVFVKEEFIAVVVVAIGLAQIAIGGIIELYFAGFMAHVGAAFINEGVNDLMYAVGALKSGYFSWQEYGKHKFQSVITTVVSVGVAGFLSRGVKVSRYGRKLAESGYKCTGLEVANASGKRLIETVGCKIASKEVAKRIALKSAESIVFGITNSMADAAIENYLQNVCDNIGNRFITKAMKAADDHSISNRLKEVYDTLGVSKAKQMMDEITNSAFSEHNIFETYGPMASKVQAAVVQGFAQGIAKQNSHGKTNEQTKEYHDKLLKLYRKTRNSTFVAAIILENIPMDLTCVKACSFVLPRVLKNLGINAGGLELTVVGENGMEQTFCSASNEKIKQKVTLTLKDNHYTICKGGSQDRPSGTDIGINDCLFTALSHQFPELRKLGAKRFRELIAQSIMEEPELKHHIRKGYHNLPIKQGAYGGRRKTEVIEESSSTSDFDHIEGDDGRPGKANDTLT
ncbi:uncharacterized protein LOC131285441 [Anopheles ziemanni]|uniref:uncharacterized protein LOC131266476 n=1 Tax=Anopheles coustani TaxID=139045 RepID=UPI00265980ED|nr:uncharacterized protein LOC131266476 [Anopheles coustani]XP_058170279.1 uncharacterized protein LOC131285441 [Anopheles ziemanni]